MDRQNENAEQLRFLLTAGMVRDALVLLNTLSTCRFTALFRFDDADLQNLVLVDRENSTPPLMDTIPVGDSYCAFVQASRTPFFVDNSLLDARLDGHPKQPLVRSYVGIPLKSSQGAVFGTLCHFDFDVADVPQDALVLTEQVATFLDPHLAVDAAAESFERSLEALDAMLDLIFAASADRASSADAFDEYAAPLREDARGKLPSERYAEVEGQLAVLKQKLMAMDWQEPTRCRVNALQLALYGR